MSGNWLSSPRQRLQVGGVPDTLNHFARQHLIWACANPWARPPAPGFGTPRMYLRTPLHRHNLSQWKLQSCCNNLVSLSSLFSVILLVLGDFTEDGPMMLSQPYRHTSCSVYLIIFITLSLLIFRWFIVCFWGGIELQHTERTPGFKNTDRWCRDGYLWSGRRKGSFSDYEQLKMVCFRKSSAYDKRQQRTFKDEKDLKSNQNPESAPV